MKPRIVYIHGAFASSIGFIRIMEKLPNHIAYTPEYTIEDALDHIIMNISNSISEVGEPVSIVSHSLGGVIAVAISQINPLVTNILTMGTPFGGCKAADMIKWFNKHIMFDNISTTSPILRRIAKTPLTCPIKSIVTSKGGNPMFTEPNDGVVTVASQTMLLGPEYVYMDVNHSEVLVTDLAIQIAKDFIFK